MENKIKADRSEEKYNELKRSIFEKEYGYTQEIAKLKTEKEELNLIIKQIQQAEEKQIGLPKICDLC